MNITPGWFSSSITGKGREYNCDYLEHSEPTLFFDEDEEIRAGGNPTLIGIPCCVGHTVLGLAISKTDVRISRCNKQ